MKFIANPVRVDAAQIVDVVVFDQPHDRTQHVELKLDDGNTYRPSPEQLARIKPAPGDYLVTQDDGYAYLVPRLVFERKYHPEGQQVRFVASDNVAGFVRDVAERVRDIGEPVEAAVIVYGTYGGKFFVESTESGVTALGLLDIGNRTMLDAIVRPLEG